MQADPTVVMLDQLVRVVLMAGISALVQATIFFTAASIFVRMHGKAVK